MEDIQHREHVVLFVNHFYDKVKSDNLLGPLFAHVNWPTHLPTMYNFWSSMLLGDRSYTGNPFEKHAPLSIRSEHFDRWIKLFHQTINENFSGERANETKERAQSIARVWQFKLEQIMK